MRVRPLGKAEETKAFFNTYQDDLVDNDQAMWVGVSQEDPTHPGDTPDDSDRSEDDEDEEKPQQVVSAHEIRKQVLERLEEGVCSFQFERLHGVAYLPFAEYIRISRPSMSTTCRGSMGGTRKRR